LEQDGFTPVYLFSLVLFAEEYLRPGVAAVQMRGFCALGLCSFCQIHGKSHGYGEESEQLLALHDKELDCDPAQVPCCLWEEEHHSCQLGDK